jgi:NAD(P)-dependent dehydrogenase (short-subunit alcohol dehydrogenase family)
MTVAAIPPNGELSGKVALVTGAGKGIGRAIALRLAEAGAAVVLSGRDVGALTETLDTLPEPAVGKHLVAPVDLSDADSVAELAARVDRVDVLVNNSGIGGPSAPLWEVDAADWHETVAVNLTGTFLICKAFMPGMVARSSGSVVLIGSMTGKRPLLHRAPYATTKLGLVGLCRTLALDAGPYGVRVNVVSPGFVEGPRLDWVIEKQAAARGIPVAEARAIMSSEAPLRSFVTPQDVANAALYLGSDRSGGVTGTDLNVSAGLAMY